MCNNTCSFNNSINMKLGNSTYNSIIQNKLNIYSIGSDYNSPHLDTDENIVNNYRIQELEEKNYDNNNNNNIDNIDNMPQTEENNHQQEDDNNQAILQDHHHNNFIYNFHNNQEASHKPQINDDSENEEIYNNNNYNDEILLSEKEFEILKKTKSANIKNSNFNFIKKSSANSGSSSSKVVFNDEKNLHKMKANKQIIHSSYSNNTNISQNMNQHNGFISCNEEFFENKLKLLKNPNNPHSKSKIAHLQKTKNSLDISTSKYLSLLKLNNTNITSANNNSNLNCTSIPTSDLNLCMGLKQRKSKDKVLIENTNTFNNINNLNAHMSTNTNITLNNPNVVNNNNNNISNLNNLTSTLSNISSPKLTGNKLVFNSDKEININGFLQNLNENNLTPNSAHITSNLQNMHKKKVSNSQLNTSDTSSYKFKEIRTKIKQKVCNIDNTNIGEHAINNVLSLSPDNHQNLANTDNEKYCLTNNTNEEDYSVSEIGFLSSSNKVDSGGMSRNTKNKFINFEKNFMLTHINSVNTNNNLLIKKYKNLNELGEILDDSNEKNIKSEANHNDPYKTSLSFVLVDNCTQTSLDGIHDIDINDSNDRENKIKILRKFMNANSEKMFVTNTKHMRHNKGVAIYTNEDLESFQEKQIKNYFSDNDKNQAYNCATDLAIEDKSKRNNDIKRLNGNKSNFKITKAFEFTLAKQEADKIEPFEKPEKSALEKELFQEMPNKEFISNNSSKILESISDGAFYSDQRYCKLKNHYEDIQTENERLIITESELLKTIMILKDFIKVQEVNTYIYIYKNYVYLFFYIIKYIKEINTL